MEINPSILTLDIKVQDKFRELLAKMGEGLNPLTGVVLGDSDIDYNLLDMQNARILNAPFNVNKIKYPLIYSGSEQGGLEGNITCFVRRIYDGDTQVSSLYNYPPTMTFTPGNTPPVLNNGYDWNVLAFDTHKQAQILFFQTLLMNYYDPTTNLMYRFNEPMDIKVTFSLSSTVPTGWELTIDEGTSPITVGTETVNVFHNSLCLSRVATGSSTVGLNTNGLITVTGKLSNIVKKVAFNI